MIDFKSMVGKSVLFKEAHFPYKIYELRILKTTDKAVMVKFQSDSVEWKEIEDFPDEVFEVLPEPDLRPRLKLAKP